MILSNKQVFALKTLALIANGGVVWWWELQNIYNLSDYPQWHETAMRIGARQ